MRKEDDGSEFVRVSCGVGRVREYICGCYGDGVGVGGRRVVIGGMNV